MTRIEAGCGGNWARYAAWVALAVLVGAQLLTGLHFALVRHVLGSEPGGVAHAVRVREAPEAMDPLLAAPDGASHASPDQSTHALEHCSLPLGAIQNAALAPSTPVVTGSASRCLEPSGFLARAAVRSIALLALAPKQSPPAGRA